MWKEPLLIYLLILIGIFYYYPDLIEDVNNQPQKQLKLVGIVVFTAVISYFSVFFASRISVSFS